MVLYLKNVVRPSCDHRATCENSRVRLPELEKNGEGGQNAGKQSGSGQVMRLRFRCDESVSRTNNTLFSSDFLLYLTPTSIRQHIGMMF